MSHKCCTNCQCYVQVKTAELALTLVRGCASCPGVDKPGSGEGVPAPVCRFVNVELCDASPQCGVKGCQGTVLLENPRGDFNLSLPALIHQVSHAGVTMMHRCNNDTGVTMMHRCNNDAHL